ncbi:MAG: MFS transporter, partial [Pseudomonadota bacterium]
MDASVGPFGLLKTRRFAPLLIAQTLGAFNDNLFKQALIISLAYGGVALTGVPTETLVLASAALYVAPFFLFSAIAGQVADKFERSALVRRIKTVEIGVMAFAALGFLIGSAPMLLASIFLAGAQSAFFQPVKNALLPDYLSRAELAVGNGVMSGATFLSILIGTVAGAVLIRHPLGGLIFCLLALTAALCGRASAGAAPQTAAGAPGARIRWNALTESARLIAHALSLRGLARPFVGTLWVWLMGAAIIAVMPIYARDVLGGDPTVAAMMMAV